MADSQSQVPAHGLVALGSLKTAEDTARRAARAVPAYRHFLAAKGATVETPFTALPRIDMRANTMAEPTAATATISS